MLLLLLIILVFLVVTTLLSLIFPIGGVWERLSTGNQSIWDRERIVLKQFGPLLIGQQNIHGGKQSFLGFAIASSIWLRRRDYGIQALIQQGFPEDIAKLVQGRVLLRLHLKLSPDHLFLKGEATPYKVEFYEDGSGIKSIQAVEPTLRSYRRAELRPVKESALTVGKPVYDV